MERQYLRDYTTLILRRFRSKLEREVNAVKQVPTRMYVSDDEIELAEEWLDNLGDEHIDDVDLDSIDYRWLAEFDEMWQSSNRSAIRLVVVLIEAIEEYH